MDEWMAVTVLPNIELETAIEGGMIALAPRDDARVSALCKGHPNLRSFMGKFTDAFGVKLRPLHIDRAQGRTKVSNFRRSYCQLS